MRIDQSFKVMDRAENEMRDAWAALIRAAYGDEEYHREVVRIERMDEEAANTPPPSEPSRIVGWKRRRWARKLLGR